MENIKNKSEQLPDGLSPEGAAWFAEAFRWVFDGKSAIEDLVDVQESMIDNSLNAQRRIVLMKSNGKEPAPTPLGTRSEKGSNPQQRQDLVALDDIDTELAATR